MNRNDLDEELEEKVVDEGRKRWRRPHADIFDLLDDLGAPEDKKGKWKVVFLGVFATATDGDDIRFVTQLYGIF